MNMINLDMYAMRQMRNYRLRIKFARMPYSGGCGITVRTTLFDAIEGYSYTEEDLEKYGASELISQSITKFVDAHYSELFTAIYNDETASLSQEIRDIIQRFKLHYTISYTIRGRNCTIWSDLFDCKNTYNYMVTRSNRVMTNAKIIEDAIRNFYNDNSHIFNKEETTMSNDNDVREELSSWKEAYTIKNRECRKLSEDVEKLSSWIAAYKKTNKMLKDIICERNDTICKRDEDLRNLTKKNESLAEDVDMYQHLLMEINVDNEKLKDKIQTLMNNEKLDVVRISDLEETVKMLREIIRGKDTAIQDDAEAFRTEIDSLNKKIDLLKSDRDALNKENIRLCKMRLNEVYGANYNIRDEELISPKLARILAVAEHFTTERDFLVWNIAKSALKGNTHHTFCTELSMDTITLLMSLGYDITYNSTDHGTTIDVSWED